MRERGRNEGGKGLPQVSFKRMTLAVSKSRLMNSSMVQPILDWAVCFDGPGGKEIEMKGVYNSPIMFSDR